MNNQPLHQKYRPQTLGDMLGQDEVCASLEGLWQQENCPHAYLFSGPSGCGKTTLARIAALELGIEPGSMVEIDAASNTGIDDMRRVMASAAYQGFGSSPNKGYIIDECHRLSKNAWDSLLKIIEEPPPHVYFFLCTTEPEKVPKTIHTRCAEYAVRILRYDDLMDLLESICKTEEYETPEAVLALIARSAQGSARAALTKLAVCAHCLDPEEAASLLVETAEDADIIELVKSFCKGEPPDWPQVASAIKATEASPESIRIMAATYIAGWLGNAKEKNLPWLLDCLEEFSTPFNTSDKLAPVYLAFGNLYLKAGA
jgi:DNA polymerase III subunit gamma/tau